MISDDIPSLVRLIFGEILQLLSDFFGSISIFLTLEVKNIKHI